MNSESKIIPFSYQNTLNTFHASSHPLLHSKHLCTNKYCFLAVHQGIQPEKWDSPCLTLAILKSDIM